MAGVKGEKLARFDLIPPEAAWYEAMVYGHGAQKYASRNWEMGYDWGKTISALERHIQLFKAGQDLDEESGLPHMAHARWHTGVIITFQARNLGTDDRATGVDFTVMEAGTLNLDEIKQAKAKELVTA